MATQAPAKLAKRIAGACLYSGCHDSALDGSDYCAPHDAHERGRAANRQRRHRQKLADMGLCIAGCGRKVAKRRGMDGRILRRRCIDCRKQLMQSARDSREKLYVTGEDCRVTGEPPGLWRVDPGTDKLRYRGKGRRGQLTREEQIDEDIRDVGFAKDELEKLARALAELKRPEVLELPRIQREAVGRGVMLYVNAAARFLDGLAEKYG